MLYTEKEKVLTNIHNLLKMQPGPLNHSQVIFLTRKRADESWEPEVQGDSHSSDSLNCLPYLFDFSLHKKLSFVQICVPGVSSEIWNDNEDCHLETPHWSSDTLTSNSSSLLLSEEDAQ